MHILKMSQGSSTYLRANLNYKFNSRKTCVGSRHRYRSAPMLGSRASKLALPVSTPVRKTNVAKGSHASARDPSSGYVDPYLSARILDLNIAGVR